MEEYMKLSDEDKKRVQKLCQQLFHKNYITEYIFANNDNLRKSNPDYNFIQSHFQIFEELLEATGWKLNDERDFGVIYNIGRRFRESGSRQRGNGVSVCHKNFI